MLNCQFQIYLLDIAINGPPTSPLSSPRLMTPRTSERRCGNCSRLAQRKSCCSPFGCLVNHHNLALFIFWQGYVRPKVAPSLPSLRVRFVIFGSTGPIGEQRLYIFTPLQFIWRPWNSSLCKCRGFPSYYTTKSDTEPDIAVKLR